MLAIPIAGQAFESVPWRDGQMPHIAHSIDLIQLAPGYRPQLTRTGPPRHRAVHAVEVVFRARVVERTYHGPHYNACRHSGRLICRNHKPGNNPVVILLTDGAPVGATPDEVRAAAAAAKAAGMLTYTIGLGQGVDHALLVDVASRPEWYVFAPDTGDLAEIHGQIAYSIPCKPMWPRGPPHTSQTHRR